MRLSILFLLLVFITGPALAGSPSKSISNSTVVATPQVKTNKSSEAHPESTPEPKKAKKRRGGGRGALITLGILCLAFGLAVMMIAGILVLLSISVVEMLIIGIGLLVAALIFFIIANVIKKKGSGKKGKKGNTTTEQ